MDAEFFHRLWVTISVCGGALHAVCTARSFRRERRARRRGATIFARPREEQRAPRERALPQWARAWLPVVGVFFSCWALVGGVSGLAVGAIAALSVRRRLRAALPDPERATADEAARGLPLAADLLAACAAAGAGPREAAEAVGDSLGGVAGVRLSRAAAEITLGSEPRDAWGKFGDIPGAAGLARCLERSFATGAPAAEPLARLAEGLRAERTRRATARAQRAQVLISAPVAVCFLPAFLTVGVAPVVIGLATGILHAA
jgi:pilus assembly protein TadC